MAPEGDRLALRSAQSQHRRSGATAHAKQLNSYGDIALNAPMDVTHYRNGSLPYSTPWGIRLTHADTAIRPTDAA